VNILVTGFRLVSQSVRAREEIKHIHCGVSRGKRE
jgi:hypothetical protein